MRLPSFANTKNLMTTSHVEDDIIELSPDELDFLQKVYRDPRQPMSRRMHAAKIAIDREHPRLPARDCPNEKDMATRLDKAIEASNRAKVVKVIEHEDNN